MTRAPKYRRPISAAAERAREKLDADIRAQMARVRADQNRLIEAWIAETGLLPSESVLVQQLCADGATRTWVERREPVATPPADEAEPAKRWQDLCGCGHPRHAHNALGCRRCLMREVICTGFDKASP